MVDSETTLWARKLADIGNSTEPVREEFTTASSSRLRQCCFGKLLDDKVNHFPNHRKCINSTKFSACWIHPFLEKDDYCSVVHLVKKSGPKLDEADVQTGPYI